MKTNQLIMSFEFNSTTGQRQGTLTTATVTDEVSSGDSLDANQPSDTGESLKSGGNVPQDSSGTHNRLQ